MLHSEDMENIHRHPPEDVHTDALEEVVRILVRTGHSDTKVAHGIAMVVVMCCREEVMRQEDLDGACLEEYLTAA